MIDGLNKLGLDVNSAKPLDVVIEPWMEKFVRGRHSEEEWTAFYEYCHASSCKRRLIRWGGIFAHIFGLI